MADAHVTHALRLIGLGVRSRGAVVGVERVREAVGRGTLRLAIVAPDASRHSQDKVRPLLAARGVPVIEGPSSTVLGHAVGREATAVVGVIDANLARGIQQSYGVVVDDTAHRPAFGPVGTAARRSARPGRLRRGHRRTD